MKYSTILVSALVAFVNAQSITSCKDAQKCLDDATSSNTDCEVGDWKCGCSTTNKIKIQEGASTCVISACGAKAAEVLDEVQSICDNVGGGDSSSMSDDSSSSASESATGSETESATDSTVTTVVETTTATGETSATDTDTSGTATESESESESATATTTGGRTTSTNGDDDNDNDDNGGDGGDGNAAAGLYVPAALFGLLVLAV